jgi:hypothetical protein
MAKKTAKKASKKAFSERPRKKGTYYDRNRIAMREKEQKRRADVKAGKITPGKGKPGPKAKVYKNEQERNAARTKYKLEWQRQKEERERIAFNEYYEKKYPLKKPSKK